MIKIILILSLISFVYSASLYENDKIIHALIKRSVEDCLIKNKALTVGSLSAAGDQLSASMVNSITSIVQPLMSSLIGSALTPLTNLQNSIDPIYKPIIRTSLTAIFNNILGN